MGILRATRGLPASVFCFCAHGKSTGSPDASGPVAHGRVPQNVNAPVEDIRGALKPLPEKKDEPDAEAGALAATGTEGSHNGCHNPEGFPGLDVSERVQAGAPEYGEGAMLTSVRKQARTGCSDKVYRNVSERGAYKTMVGRGGVEPPTPAFSVPCSTS